MNIDALLAIAVLLIARVIYVCMGPRGTCAVDCMVICVCSVATVTQSRSNASFRRSSGVVIGVVTNFTTHDGSPLR
jgi:hypothetical protein